jgi:hypothetical protein
MKYLAMLYHFNGQFSLWAAHTAALLVFTVLAGIKFLTPYGHHLPAFHLPMPGNTAEYPLGLTVCGPCFFVGGAVQMCTYVFGHHYPCRRLHRETVFLDKSCIHQTDPDRKQEGIRHVGGFVSQSSSMFVPWDDNYFERLWCTYEVAAFVACKRHQTTDCLTITPIQVAVFVLGIALLGFVGTCGFMFMVVVNQNIFEFWYPQMWWEYFLIWGTGGTLIFGLPKFIYCHFSVQSRRDLETKLSNFSVLDAKVTCADDRDFIEDHIKAWFGSLEVFDGIVQKLLPQIVHKSIGTEKQGLRLVDVLQENAGVLFLLIYDASLSALPHPWKVARCLVMGLSAHLVIDPLFLFSLNVLARYTVDLKRGEYVKHSIRALGVFLLGLIYPAWFAMCINVSLPVSTLVSVCLGALVPMIFNR